MNHSYTKTFLLSAIAASSIFGATLHSMERLDSLCIKQLQTMEFLPNYPQESFVMKVSKNLTDFISRFYRNSNGNMKKTCDYFISNILPKLQAKPYNEKISIINQQIDSIRNSQEIDKDIEEFLEILLVQYLGSLREDAYECSKIGRIHCNDGTTMHCYAILHGYSSILSVLVANTNHFETKCSYFKIFTDQLNDKKSEQALIYFLEKILPVYAKSINDSCDKATGYDNALACLERFASSRCDEENEANSFQKELTQFIVQFFKTISTHELTFIPPHRLHIAVENLRDAQDKLIYKTPINCAAMFGLNTILSELVKKSSFDLTKNPENQAALLLLINSGKAKMETINKIDTDETHLFSYQNKYRQTPLHIAISNENYSTKFCTKLIIHAINHFCKSLLEYKNQDGKTPLHLAIKGKKAGIIAVIVKIGSTKLMYINDLNNKTPLDLAQQSNDPVILDIIQSARKQEVTDCLKLLKDK